MLISFLTGNKEEELDSDDLDDDTNEESDDEQEEGTSNGTETLSGLRRYMDQMDEELMGTKIGQSFKVTVNMFFSLRLFGRSVLRIRISAWTLCLKHAGLVHPSTMLMFTFSLQNSEKADLDNSPPRLSADCPPTKRGSGQTEEEIQPLDLDLNLVTNLLESLSCQEGLAGPASNLLQSLGINLPANSDPS